MSSVNTVMIIMVTVKTLIMAKFVLELWISGCMSGSQTMGQFARIKAMRSIAKQI